MSNNIISSKECWSRIANPSLWRQWQQQLRVLGWAVKQRHLFPAEQSTCGAPELLDLVVCCRGFMKLGFFSKHRCILWLFSIPLKVNFISLGLGPTRIITRQLDLLLLLNLPLEAASASWEAVFWSMMQQLKCLPSADVHQCIWNK